MDEFEKLMLRSKETLKKAMGGLAEVAYQRSCTVIECNAIEPLYTHPAIHGKGVKNAMQHGLVSATYAYKGHPDIIKLMGDIKESFQAASGNNRIYLQEDIKDSWADRYNNAVGLAIGNYAKSMGCTAKQLTTMLLDALSDGAFIAKLDDKRIVLGSEPIPTWKEPSKQWSLLKEQHEPVAYSALMIRSAEAKANQLKAR